MFPIIPKHAKLNSSVMTSSEENILRVSVNQRNQKSKEALARASGYIPANAVTSIWFTEDLCLEDHTMKQLPLLLHYHEGHIQTFSLDKNSMWPQLLPTAADIQSQNVILEIHKTEEQKYGMILRSVKNISAGDEIQMWFSEEIAALISMPFLTPKNIRDQKRYVCHMCGEHYESPNPLKIHIALNCGQLPITSIWDNIRNTLISLNSQNTVPLNLSNKLIMKPHEERLKYSPNLCEQDNQDQNTKRQSAFMPYSIKNYVGSIDTNFPLILPHMNYSISPHTPVQIPNSISELNYRTHASEMEAIVSNLGKSNKGHLCIYCGKVYSRKYGLKIHIRTHTGFKPLKCKFCARAFGDPSNLNKHVRLHMQGESPYRCDICNKVLVRRRDLQRHLQTRHGTGTSATDCDSSD